MTAAGCGVARAREKKFSFPGGGGREGGREGRREGGPCKGGREPLTHFFPSWYPLPRHTHSLFTLSPSLLGHRDRHLLLLR